MKKLPMPSGEIEVSQTSKDKWQQHLLLALTSPHRLLGLVDLQLSRPAPWEVGEPFELHHVCVYASQIGFQPLPDGRGVTIGGPRLVIPFDGLAPIYSIPVTQYSGTFFPDRQPKDCAMRELLLDGYLRIFDPPKIIQPPAGNGGDLITKP